MSAAPADLAWPLPPTDLASARAMLSFAADAGLRGLITDKQAGAATKACDSFIRAERFVEQIRALTKEIDRLKKAIKPPA